MSQYTQSDAQKRFLKRRAINKAKNVRCCDCPGCSTCKGFVAGCTCDEQSVSEILDQYRYKVDRCDTVDVPTTEGEPRCRTRSSVRQLFRRSSLHGLRPWMGALIHNGSFHELATDVQELRQLGRSERWLVGVDRWYAFVEQMFTILWSKKWVVSLTASPMESSGTPNTGTSHTRPAVNSPD